MNLAYLNDLLDFNYWGRDRIVAAAATLSPEQYTQTIASSFPSVRETLNHMYMGEWVWYSRWNGESPTSFPTDQDLTTLAALQARWAGLEANMRALVGAKSESDISQVYDYKLLSGAPGRSKFWEMFVHVVNHGTYHRGQVTTMLRQLGAKPPESTDMIAFFRSRA